MMNWLALLVIGGILGWVASMIMRTDARMGLLLNILAGIAGAWLAGLVVPGGSILGGVTMKAVLVSLGGAVLLLGVVNLALKGRLR